MKMLQYGILCYDGNKKKYFTLRTLNEMNRYVYYLLQQNINPIQLPIRTYNEMLTSINQIEHLKGDRRETYIRNCGKFYPKNDERNSNNYTISSKTWIEIGEIMEKNRSNMPSDIRCPPRNIIKHSARFKAVKWANWIILFSLPLLKDGQILLKLFSYVFNLE
ncbi:hypothetical protein C1646_776566 [Rhizophagus diaphanus]|nr:hypothetical protein C1646_776566 [Rhizophagus diaphanus] [Rhizophagus sp. MUCL 43196]